MELQIATTIPFDDEQLDKAIIDAAAAQLLGQVNLSGRFGGKIPEVIEAKLTEIVTARVEAMMDREIAQVDRFGAIVTGPKKTFREVFADTAEAYLTARVDRSSGKSTTDGYSSVPRLEYLIAQHGLSAMEHEFRKIAAEFKSQLQEKAKAALSAVVAEQVKKIA
jgi:hypothetical protein